MVQLWSEGLALYPTQADFLNRLQQDPHKKNEWVNQE